MTKQPEVEFDHDFVNVISYNYSMYDKSTKSNPIDTIFPLDLLFLQDVNKIAVKFIKISYLGFKNLKFDKISLKFY